MARRVFSPPHPWPRLRPPNRHPFPPRSLGSAPVFPNPPRHGPAPLRAPARTRRRHPPVPPQSHRPTAPAAHTATLPTTRRACPAHPLLPRWTVAPCPLFPARPHRPTHHRKARHRPAPLGPIGKLAFFSRATFWRHFPKRGHCRHRMIRALSFSTQVIPPGCHPSRAHNAGGCHYNSQRLPNPPALGLPAHQRPALADSKSSLPVPQCTGKAGGAGPRKPRRRGKGGANLGS